MRLEAIPVVAIALLGAASAYAQDSENSVRSSHFYLDQISLEILNEELPDTSVSELMKSFKDVFEYVSERLGIDGTESQKLIYPQELALPRGHSRGMFPDAPVSKATITVKLVSGRSSTGCYWRGMQTFQSDPSAPGSGRIVVQLHIDKATTPVQILGILAHELAHGLRYVATRGGPPAAIIVSEGFATWAAGDYWTGRLDTPSLSTSVAEFIQAGVFVPLAKTREMVDAIYPDSSSTHEFDCIALRDIVYTEWASFFEHLVRSYGRDRFFALLRDAPFPSVQPVEPGLPDFVAAYGLTLDELESRWIAGIRSGEFGN